MEKKGFTLIELLAVIVLIALITVISSAGIIVVKDAINNQLWLSTKNLIERAAVDFGEDNLDYIKREITAGKVVNIKVQLLIDRGYITPKETDQYNNKVIVNNTIHKDDTGYYINEQCINITLEHDIVYAEYIGDCPKDKKES